MRRISLALALVGAVAATGCGQTSKPATTGGNRGIESQSFKLTVRGEKRFETGTGATLKVYMLPEGGLVTGNGINCGFNATGVAQTACEAMVPYGTAVALQVANFFGNNGAVPPVSYGFYGFAGACTGSGTTTGATACGIDAMNADRLVLVRFAFTSAGLGSHGPYQDPAVHGAAYVTGALTCSQCHGATLGGAGNAPSCAQCHFQAHAQSGFSSPSRHAPAYLAENLAGRNGCGDCHGANLLGANLSPSCGTCHSWPIGPHMAVTNSSHSSGACARCHVGDGFRDFIGLAVSTTVPAADVHELGYTATAGYAKAAALSGAVLGKDMKCNMCHNAKTALGDGTTVGTLNTIRFPSATASTVGVTVPVDTTTAICGQCHTTVRDDRNVQSVAAKLVGVADPDVVLATGNSAVRPHYLGAATTMLGSETPAYLQFAGNIYTARNAHGGKAACTDCHNAHTGELPSDGTRSYQIGGKCGGCHNDELTGLPVTTYAQLEESRQYGFEGDIDQDGTPESLKLEIEGLKAKLVAALKSYSTQVVGAAADLCFAYDSKGLADQPFVQVDPVTAVTCGTGTNNVAYNQFTARSLKAAFNYMAIQNDPGAWAHNPRYVTEILFDSINDLNDGLVGKTFAASPNGLRAFNGHFGAADAASPYSAMVYHATIGTSDTTGAMGFTSAACYQCHGGAVGLQTYLTGMPAALAAIPAGGKVTAFQCATCHTFNGTNMQGLRAVSKVYFPPQKAGAAAAAEVSFDAAFLPTTFALCGTCHSARENKASVDAKVLTAGTFDTGLVNMHYLGAAATVMGTRAKSWYEYSGNTYTGFPVFWASGTRGTAPGPHGSPHGAECTGCHRAKESKHSFGVDYTYCGSCHAGAYALTPKEQEFNSMKTELLAALDAYAAANLTAFQAGNGATATGLCYDGSVYGYVLVKTAAGCSTTGAKLDLNSMRAAYNLHWMNKDPGAWAHNEYYAMQLAYDSIVALGGTPTFEVHAVLAADRVTPACDPLNRPATLSCP